MSSELIPKVRTGVPGLDILLHGGLPRGRATLVCGKSGAAKSILALQLASTLARSGLKTLLFAVEETPEDLLTSARSLGFDLAGLVADGKARIVDIARPAEGVLISGGFDISGLLDRISADTVEFGAEAFVLDSATALFSPRPPEPVLRALFLQLVQALRRHNLTSVITAEAPADYGPLTTLGVEDFVCDAVLVLRNLVDAERRRRTIEIHKYRRSGHYKGEYPCTITAKGMVVFPLDAGERTDMDPMRRFPSGLPGLDELNNGGWLRDSIVLLRGPSGSGKTTLAGMYARAAALRGERAVYYGFEETKSVLMRNFATLDMAMEGLERDGLLRIACRYPEATSPEDLLVDMRVGLDEFTPSIVVLDSVSSIEHSTSTRGFRHFMVGLASLLRERGRSALLTETVLPKEPEPNAPYLFTIPDAILSLSYDEDQDDLDRTIRVLKMRGSRHLTEKRRLTISEGGLQVERIVRAG
ncbi:MAG: circadian clock protein KaiC [Myxococcales bacterium]